MTVSRVKTRVLGQSARTQAFHSVRSSISDFTGISIFQRRHHSRASQLFLSLNVKGKGKGKGKKGSYFFKGNPPSPERKALTSLREIPHLLKERGNLLSTIPRNSKLSPSLSLREIPEILNYPRPFLLESGHFQFYISKPSLSFIKSESSKILKPR